jgi:hypothetical protein
MRELEHAGGQPDWGNNSFDFYHPETMNEKKCLRPEKSKKFLLRVLHPIGIF